jgi:hypothetical protein
MKKNIQYITLNSNSKNQIQELEQNFITAEEIESNYTKISLIIEKRLAEKLEQVCYSPKIGHKVKI